MNRELINKINEAIKNNDREMIEKLAKEYNVKINYNISSSGVNNNFFANNNNEFNNNNFNVKIVSRKTIDPKSMIENDDNDYFRDIPCDNDLFVIYFLASSHGLMEQESDIFGAFLLKWINENKIKYIIRRKGIFRRKNPMFILDNNVVIDDDLEKKIYEFIKKISKNNILEMNEFNKWLKKNPYLFIYFLKNLKNCSSDRLIKAGLGIQDNNMKQNNMFIDNQNLMNNGYGNISNSYKIISKSSFILTPKYHEYLQQIADFKKIIKDFSLIHEKDIIETKLWGDYLVVSQLLGLADDVSDELDDLVPDFKIGNNYSEKTTVKIKVSGNVSRDMLESHLNNEMKKIVDDMFRF